jgi:hypothetical protein
LCRKNDTLAMLISDREKALASSTTTLWARSFSCTGKPGKVAPDTAMGLSCDPLEKL